VATDPLTEAAPAAVNRGADADLGVPAVGARGLLVELDPPQRRVDEQLRAIALLVRVVEELGDDDAPECAASRRTRPAPLGRRRRWRRV
jgi:hypothetical protein